MEPLHGERVSLRPATDADTATLDRIVREPEVAAWWAAPESPQKWKDMYAVLVDGEIVGAAQYDEEEDPEYRHAGIDLFLTGAHHGEGLGTDTVRTLARWLTGTRGHHRLTIDPAADNAAAIGCYAKAGFRPVGVLRAYWRDPATGIWRDGLLMDLLAHELTS